MKIQPAVYPQRSCRDHVWGVHQAYACEIPEMHNGPCVSLSVRASIQRRESWEAQQDAQREEQTS